ncbi:hypothetical protein [Couchioplanes caeruleus]|uniref:Uncharacterized protein n=1 Tax=Couchioplanes caeruleus TaxID=56438 RepID=A0A3N1GKZ1_9ACTN|nr:hypothetical protein [Couchioplanes caeruleus]ROP30947.1 hypothetical protein EDD30_3832 [Couchioplanes caeruleus]
MSERHLHIQHAEVIDRNRRQRLATQVEAQRQADQRREAQARRAQRDDADEF